MLLGLLGNADYRVFQSLLGQDQAALLGQLRQACNRQRKVQICGVLCVVLDSCNASHRGALPCPRWGYGGRGRLAAPLPLLGLGGAPPGAAVVDQPPSPPSPPPLAGRL